MLERVKKVKFVDTELYTAFLELTHGRSEEKELAGEIEQAVAVLKINPLTGIRIPKQLWPAAYIRKYGITNLRKCDLKRGWRLIYTLEGNELEIVSIILEWFGHKNYEKRFGYKVK